MAPTRSCVVCRSRKDQDGLLRFVKCPDGLGGLVWPDPMRIQQGRGAYVCIEGPCLRERKLSQLLWRQLWKNKGTMGNEQSILPAVQEGLRNLRGSGKRFQCACSRLALAASVLAESEPRGLKKKGIRL